jgi:hypothetical protein
MLQSLILSPRSALLCCQPAVQQNVHQVVPAIVQLLQQLPNVWLAPQTGPKQVQADYTQVMMDLRK